MYKRTFLFNMGSENFTQSKVQKMGCRMMMCGIYPGIPVHICLEYIFGIFPVLAERRHQEGGTLSGGEQQMLAISRALMARPKLLLLDEPSMGLAPRIIGQIFETLRKINEEHRTTILLVEQNANLALKVASRGYVMENGLVTIEDSAAGLLANEEVKRAYLGL